VLRKLGVQPRSGLTGTEVIARRLRYGDNALPRTEPRSGWAIFADQLTNLPILLLGASAGISLVTGGVADAVVIGAVVLLNAGIATRTEKQAERTILGLSQYRPHPVRVRRDGERIEVPPSELVPGDVLDLEPGTLIAADARLVGADDLTVNESALTGEALPVHKDAAAGLRADVPLADRVNMVYRGTAVTGGRGQAVVAATGARSEIGRIQTLLGAVRPPETPIQRELGEVEKELVIVNGALCAVVFGLGLLRGEGWLPMLRTAISLAVAAIPEGLPAVATTTLAVGIQDMRRRGVLVRKLEAVETLGAVETVGMDKTGTLTQNRMMAVALHVDAATFDVDGGTMAADGKAADPKARQIATRLCEVAALCSDATLQGSGTSATVAGTPTEAALVRAAIDFGIDVAAVRRAQPIERTAQRALGRKRMSTLHAGAGGRRLLCVKGDPIEVLERCTLRLARGGPVALDAASRAEILTANQRMAGRALRVLGVAVRDGGGDPKDESALTWLGLAGLADPIRPGAPAAIRQMHGAGIRTVMVTGDQSATAFAIARELDLAEGAEVRVLEAGRIRGLDPKLLAAIAANPHVFARVSPVDKLEIVRALQAGGHIVAMTGDGINDGPALKAADIGIAMGSAGTDVAREVADIVLSTDELDGMVDAIRLGRATYANIRKALRFLVGTNAAETIVMLGASVAGWPEPLHPMQLLWLNLVTDVLPGLALGLEPPEPDVMEQPPHDPRVPILEPADFRRLLLEGAILGAGTLAAFLAEGGLRDPRHAGPNPPPTRGSTVAFHGLTLSQLAHAIACRSENHGILEEFRRPANARLYAALAACLALQAGAQALPATRRLLGLTPLRATDLGVIAAVALGSVVANEAAGAILYRRGAARPARSTGASPAAPEAKR
jgi:Ca2+-transporting ATPase